MPPSAARTVSRQVIRDVQALIACAREVIRQSRWARGQQPSLTIVCAWCQQTIRGQRPEEAPRGLISHSICRACFTDVLQELDPANAFPPVPTKTETAPLASYLRLVP